MNKIFKVIWNHATQSWVATSELSRSKGKTKSLRTAKSALAAAIAVVATSGSAYAAMAVGGDPVSGLGEVKVGTWSATNPTVSAGDIATSSGASVTNQDRGTAIGQGAKVSFDTTNVGLIRQSGGTAIGNNASVVDSLKGVAIGMDAKVANSSAVVVGTNATAAQNAAVRNQAGLVVIGTDALIRNTANGQSKGSTAIGSNSLGGLLTGAADSTISTTNADYNTESGGLTADKLMYRAGITDAAGTRVGTLVSNEVTAIGFDSRAIGDQSIAIGAQTVAGHSSVAIGGNDMGTAANQTNKDKYQGIVGVPLAENGIDLDGDGRMTAADWWETTYAKDGSVAIGQKAHSNELFGTAIGTSAFVEAGAELGTAIGTGARVGNQTVSTAGAMTAKSEKSTKGGVAIAAGAVAEGDFTTAVGTGANALEVNATALGYKALANATNATAVGAAAIAAADNALAYGANATAYAANSVAIGTNATVTSTGESSIAFGSNTNVSGERSVALGNNITALSTNGSVVLGDSSTEVVTTQQTEADGTVKNVTAGTDGMTVTPVETVKSVTIGSGAATLTYDGFAGQVSDAGQYVSVGRKDAERQIKNVAPGAITNVSTDAINGSQLYAALDVLGSQVGQIYFHTNNGTNANTGDKVENIGNITEAAGAQGLYSTTAGVKSTATSEYGIAYGYNSTAKGSSGKSGGAISLGSNTLAYDGSIALGINTTVKGNDATGAIGAIAIGRNAHIDVEDGSASSSIAIGNGTFASGSRTGYATAYNKDRVALGVSTAVGDHAYATNGAAAFGQIANAIGQNATALGHVATASGNWSTATGYTTTASGQHATATGAYSVASGDSSSAFGHRATAEAGLSFAAGPGARVIEKAGEGIAIGMNALTEDKLSTSIGSKANARGQGSISFGANSQTTENANASIAMGSWAFANGFSSMATGHNSAAWANRSMAAGNQSMAVATNASASGVQSVASGERGIAIGTDAAAGLSRADADALPGMQSTYVRNRNSYLSAQNALATRNEELAAAQANATEADAAAAAAAAVAALDPTNADAIKNVENTAAAAAKAKEALQKATANATSAQGNLTTAQANFENIEKQLTAKLDALKASSKVDTIAIGTNTTVTGEASIAIGRNSNVTGTESIAVGVGHVVEANNAGTFGDLNYIRAGADRSYAFGNNNTITTADTFVLGSNVSRNADGTDNAVGTVANSVYLGNGTEATAGAAVGTPVLNTDQVAGTTTTAGDKGTVTEAKVANITYGGFAGATANGVVSVGAAGAERRVQNVAAGEISKTSTDAINGSQLYFVYEQAAKPLTITANTNKDTDAETLDKTYKAGDGTQQQLGETLAIIGATTAVANIARDTAAPTAGTYSAKNVQTVVSDNEVQIQIAEKPEFKEITVKSDVTDTNPVVISSGTGNTGGTISNLTTTLPEPSTINGGESGTAPANPVTTNAATLGDVLNAGWNLQGDTKAVDLVKPYDTVNFIDGMGTNVTVSTGDQKTSTIKVDINLADPNLTTTVGDTKLTDGTDGKDGKVEAPTTGGDKLVNATTVADAINASGWNAKSGGNKADGDMADATLINPSEEVTFTAGKNLTVKRVNNEFTFATAEDVDFNSTTVGNAGDKITIGNVGGKNVVGNLDTTIAAPTTSNNPADKPTGNALKNAATLGDVLNAGWNLKENGTPKDVVTPYDTVNFVNGNGTTVTVTPSADGTSNEIKVDVNLADPNLTTTVGDTKLTNGTDGKDGKIDAPAAADGNKLVNATTVADAINASGFTLKSSENGGTKVSGTDEVINPGDVIDMAAGKNMTVKQDADGKITYATAEDVDFNSVTVSNGTTPAVKLVNEGPLAANNNPVAPTSSLNITNVDGKPTQLTGVGSVLNTTPVGTNVNTGGTATPGTSPLVNLTGLAGNILNSAATVRDLANMGWVVSTETGGYKDTVKNANEVKFIAGSDRVSVTGETNATSGVREITIDLADVKATEVTDPNNATTATGDINFADTATTNVTVNPNTGVITVDAKTTTLEPKANGSITSPADATEGAKLVNATTVANAINNSGWNAKSGGNKADGDMADATLINPSEEVTFTAGKNLTVKRVNNEFTFATAEDVDFKSVTVGNPGDKITIGNVGGKNVVGNLDTTIQAPTTSNNPADKPTGNALKNAATLGDVLNAGWNLKENGTPKDVVTPYDTVNFVNGNGTTVTVTPSADGTSNEIKVDVNLADPNLTTTVGDTKLTNGTDGKDGKIDAPAAADGNKLVNATTVADAINASGFTLKSSENGGTKVSGTDEVINPGDVIDMAAGKNMTVKQDADGKITYATAEDVDFNSVTVSNGTTPAVKLVNEGPLAANNNPVAPTSSLNITNVDGKPTQLTGVGSVLNTTPVGTNVNTGGTATPGTSPLVNLTGLAGNILNSAATVRDLANMGWVVSTETGGYKDTVKNANEVKFIAGSDRVSVTGETNATSGVREITIDLADVKATEVTDPNNATTATGDINFADTATTNVTVNPNTGVITVDAKTTTLEPKANGSITSPADATEGAKLVNATTVANAINNSGWNAKSGGNKADGDMADATLINPSEEVTFTAGKNLTVKRVNNEFTFATAEDVDFNSVTVGNVGDKITIGNVGGKNVVGNLDTTIQAPTTSNNPADKPTGDALNNAATLGDVLNAGWNLKENGTAKDVVTPYDTVNFVNGTGTTVNITNTDGATSVVKVDVKVDDKTIKVNQTTGALEAVKPTITSGADGDINFTNTTTANVTVSPAGDISVNVNTGTSSVSDGTAKDAAGNTIPAGKAVADITNGTVATISDVVNTINNVYWNTVAGKVAGSTGESTSDATAKVKAGDTVTLNAGNNIRIEQTGTTFNISTTENVTFTNTNVTNNLTVAGNTTVSNFTVKPSSTIDMGNNIIGNVSAGVKDTDAVNVSQLNATTAALKWKMTGNNNATNATAVGSQTVSFNNGNGTTAVVDGTNVTYNVDFGSANANTTTGLVNEGDISPTKVASTQTVADAINGSGWKTTDKDGNTLLVNPGDTVNYVNGNGTTANITTSKDASGKDVVNVTFDVKTANATTTNANGSIAAPTDGANFVNATTLVNTVNNASWNVNSAAVEGTTGKLVDTSDKTASKVKAGDTVNVNAGNNIEITRNGNNIAVATSMTPTFTSVQVGGATGPVISGDVNGDVKVAKKDGSAAKITNVAPGTISSTSTDAVNGSQLYSLAGDINNKFGDVHNKINRNNKDLRAGIAGANAAAGLPQVYIPGKSMVAASAGTFKGQSAVAVGYSRASDNGKLILKLQGNANTRGDVGGSVGIGYQW
ncbi:hypothetical protein EXH44_01300 [Actinobacillus indolicus]|uniref:Autotransporter adhesin n=1 Tax=Actinobacillus indolicus TaxID=51049 RepID=A0A4P7CDP0_9PAST|nr:YadA-like family protein [Actinobacillus indolicus]QBQ62958.1 hypothetical protein EXH44_01300 [Actinobacillus indolicus]